MSDSWRDYARFLNVYFRPYRWHLLLAVLATLLVSASSVVAAVLVERVSQVLLNAEDLSALNQVFAITVAIFSAVGVVAFGQIYLSAYVAQQVAAKLRDDALQHLLRLSLETQRQQRVAELMTRIGHDVETIETAIDRVATRFLRALFMPPILAGYLFYLNWRLALLAIVVVPAFVVIFLRLGKKLRGSSHRAAQSLADLNAVLQEILLNGYTVASFSSEQHEVRRFQRHNERHLRANLNQLRLVALQRPLAALLQMSSVLIIIWYAGRQIYNGALSVEQFTAFFFALGIMISSLAKLSGLHLSLQKTVVAVERYLQLLAVPVTLQDAEDAVALPNLRGEIRFDRVGFSYPQSRCEVLSDVCFTIQPGQVVALVGVSGIGKTTLMNLIPRLYDPSSGRVLLDGYDIRRATLASLRRQIGVVPQQPELFAGSLHDNIAYGTPDATEKEITRAARLANVDEFATRLADGYATQIGERGLRLSAGQRQRLAIARVFLRDPKILLLDEPTAFLDARSEQLIQQSLRQLSQDRTTLVIAHGFSTPLSADQIIVLGQGRIIETGTHEQLLSQRGYYASSYQQQLDKLQSV